MFDSLRVVSLSLLVFVDEIRHFSNDHFLQENRSRGFVFHVGDDESLFGLARLLGRFQLLQRGGEATDEVVRSVILHLLKTSRD